MTEPTQDDAPKVEFFGETFTRNLDISEFAFLEFSEAASSGLDSDTMEGAAALLRLAVECIAEDERKRFRVVARKNRAGVLDLVKVINEEAVAKVERPTGRSSDSSDGPTSIEPKSDASSDVKVSRFDGRPDLKLALARTA